MGEAHRLALVVDKAHTAEFLDRLGLIEVEKIGIACSRREPEKMNAEPLVFVFYNNNVFTFTRADERSTSTFGGPLEENIEGLPDDPRPLHQVARLALNQIPEAQQAFRRFDLPLIYGITYDGCEMSYRIKPTGRIEILELNPTTSSEDFPYVNYPLLLPYVPLNLTASNPCTYAKFAAETTNLVADQPAEMIITIPPPATLGISLWGPSGDDSEVTIVFECNLTDSTIKAYTRFIT